MNSINTTYKDSPLGKIPVDWEVKLLSELGVLISGLHLNPDDYNHVGDGLPYFTGPTDYTNEITSITKWTTKKSAIAQSGDILITVKGSGVGSLHFLELEQISIGRQIMALRANEDSSNKFIHYSLYQLEFNFKELAKGNMIPGLTRSDILTSKILTPTLPEQKVIAYILGLMDSAINTTNQLIAKKELQKKWLMQNLLAGKRRIKGFNLEWKEVQIKSVFQFLKSYSISREGLTKSYKENPIYCIHYGDIHALYETDFLDFSTQQSIPQIIDEAHKLYEKDYLKEGDVIMVDASEDYEGVGEAIVVLNLEKRIAVGGLHTIVLRDYSGETEAIFRGYLFACESVKNKLRTKATGTSVYSVTKSTLESITILLPPVKEQKSIAQVLQAADKEIQLLKTKTEKLREQKKGLMQVLLTGKKRLNKNS